MEQQLSKDERGARNFLSKHKLHHREAGRTSGPDVIVKTRNDGDESVDSNDPLGVPHPNVAYSLNKDKRWEKVRDVASQLEEGSSTVPVTFISTQVPRETGRDLFADHIPQQLSDIGRHKGGVTEYVHINVDGEVIERKSKSNKAHLESLKNQPGPGPSSRRERRMMKEEEERRRLEEEGTVEVTIDEKNANEDEGVQYIAMRLHEVTPSEREGAWRRKQRTSLWQRHHHRKGAGNGLGNEGDWDEDWENDLNDEGDLEESFPAETMEPRVKQKEDKKDIPLTSEIEIAPPLLIEYWISQITEGKEMEMSAETKHRAEMLLSGHVALNYFDVHPLTCFANPKLLGLSSTLDGVILCCTGTGKISLFFPPSV